MKGRGAGGGLTHAIMYFAFNWCRTGPGSTCNMQIPLFFRSLYRQLVEELPSEKFDERRVNLLKSKVVQLERQVSIATKIITV